MGDVNQDPSMEEILASIKRVIAEDGRQAVSSRPARGSRPTPAPTLETDSEEDVLELSEPVPEDRSLISEDAVEASRQSLSALSSLRDRAGPVGDEHPLEAVVREMLRPMLKDWLDQNLPTLVEELVTREIARINGRSH